MAIENVGLGKLPNVYFEKITLEDHDEKSFRIVSHLTILDEIEDSSFVWSEDELFSGFMKIALIATSNEGMIEELTNGENVHPTRIRSSKNWTHDSMIRMYGYGDLNKSEDIDDKHFKLKTSITKPHDASELTLFAYAYIDHKELSNYLHIKLTGLLSHYMGPVTSEIVMSGGIITKTSNLFRKPNRNVWSGPVHQIGDEWYSGAEPSDDSIDLMRERVKNSKIIDFRFKALRDRSSFMFRSMPIFSEAHYSLNSDADLFGVFSMDMKNLVLSKTKFGAAIYGLDDKMFAEVVQSIVINSAEIYRRQVRFRRQTNNLATPLFTKQDVLPREMVASMADLKELAVANDKFIKTYSFSDLEKNEGDRGEFVYEAKITFIDRTQELIEGFLTNVKLNLNGLKDVVRRLNAPNNYNDAMDSLRSTGAVPAIISAYIQDYYKYIGVIKDVEQTDLMEMIKSKQSSFNSSNYKRSYGLKFIEEYEKLHSLLSSRFGVSPKELRQTKGRPANTYPPNVIRVSKTFEELVRFNNVESSYDVLGRTDNKEILILEKNEMEARADLEVVRFFDTSKAVSSDDMFAIDDNDAEALRDLAASKMMFLAPLSFQFQGQKMSTENIANIDTDKISMKFIESKEKKVERKVSSRAKPRLNRKPMKANSTKSRRSVRRQSRKKSRFKFDFRPIVSKINQISKNKSDYRDSVEYLGPNSEFVNIETKTDRAIDASDTNQALLRISIANEVSVKRSKKQFDLTQKGSFYEKLKSSKHYSSEKLRNLPLATKALFNSRSRAAKNNIHESESDILKDVGTKVATEMIFHANQKIQALHGYEKNLNGESILSKPKWVNLTAELLNERTEILCKMTYVEDSATGVTPAEEFKMPVLNSTFVIKGSGLAPVDPTSIPDVVEELPEVSEITYTTSNIVRQPRS
jgi:hypothetical protein